MRAMKISAGAFKSWRVKISVDHREVIEPWGAIGNIIAKLIPEFVFWYDQQSPRRLLRVKADFGSAAPGSPTFLEELVEIRR